jgi:hypothetical protein
LTVELTIIPREIETMLEYQCPEITLLTTVESDLQADEENDEMEKDAAGDVRLVPNADPNIRTYELPEAAKTEESVLLMKTPDAGVND